MTTSRRFAVGSLMVLAIVWGTTAFADSVLTGAVTSATGEKMGGVTVSAKGEGSPITTSVFTDESGNYYFPPRRTANTGCGRRR